MNETLSVNTKLAIGTFLILLLSSLITVVSVNALARSNIAENTRTILEQRETQKEMQKNINDMGIRITMIETHYEHIVASLNSIEIKLEAK